MSESGQHATDQWAHLARSEMTALGRSLVTDRLTSIGCGVEPPRSRADGRLHATTPSQRLLEVFVSTQRLGGYTFWTKRRLQPSPERIAAIVLLPEAPTPTLYVLPTTEWLHAAPPLTDRDNVGKKSEPELGISLARSWLPTLERYRWEVTDVASIFG
jgi:hypothetical protein